MIADMRFGRHWPAFVAVNAALSASIAVLCCALVSAWLSHRSPEWKACRSLLIASFQSGAAYEGNAINADGSPCAELGDEDFADAYASAAGYAMRHLPRGA